MKVIVDRTEGEYAVLEMENGKMINVLKELFGNPKEGDCYEIKKCENPYKDKIRKLMDEVFE